VKVLMLRNPAAVVGCKLREGDTGEVPDSMGRALVSSGIAQCLDTPKAKPPKEPPKKVEAIPPEPEVLGVPDEGSGEKQSRKQKAKGTNG
jgi:hypothetical protein